MKSIHKVIILTSTLALLASPAFARCYTNGNCYVSNGYGGYSGYDFNTDRAGSANRMGTIMACTATAIGESIHYGYYGYFGDGD